MVCAWGGGFGDEVPPHTFDDVGLLCVGLRYSMELATVNVVAIALAAIANR